MENVIRENRNLKGTVDSMQISYNEILGEQNHLKEVLTENERVKMQMKNHMDK
jgi:hypothetical protein